MFRRPFWMIPFICFIAGYYTIAALMGRDSLETPCLRGQRLQEVAQILSAYPLKLRILDLIEEQTLPEGTVLSQHPEPGQKVKMYQPVSIVVSKRPPLSVAPACRGLNRQELIKLVQEKGLRLRLYFCHSSYPVDRCIAQIPASGSPMESTLLTAYISLGKTTLRLMPNLCNRPYGEVSNFLTQNGLKSECTPNIPDSAPIVIAQQPRSGSFIDLHKPPIVQLQLDAQQTKSLPAKSAQHG